MATGLGYTTGMHTGFDDRPVEYVRDSQGTTVDPRGFKMKRWYTTRLMHHWIWEGHAA